MPRERTSTWCDMKLLNIIAVSSVFLAASPAHADLNAVQTTPIYRITEEGDGVGIVFDRVIVITRPEDGRWVAERRRQDVVMGKTKHVQDWIDSRACPRLLEVLASLSTLAKNGVLTPDRAGVGSLILDVPTVSVTGPASVDGETEITLSDTGGAVADWWMRSSEMLKPCWQADPPKFGGVPLRPQL
ncbi:hypothetical protein [Phenylobacterium sp.]|jgi:hypothetical protein|uniref:hypothetical protein n=1 Tax=Phenylobacterium sp. TaxID=1871053 RepID=UPI0037CCA723